MKEMLRYGFILALICMVASASLTLVYFLTQPRIIAQAQAEEETSLKEVMPLGENFEAVKSADEIIYYKAYDKDTKFIGVVFKAQAKGYSSDIQTIAGMTRDGTITAIKILAQNETPGLGARIIEPTFTGQFNNKKIDALGEVQAITGATISSRAVMDSVSQKAQEIRELIREL